MAFLLRKSFVQSTQKKGQHSWPWLVKFALWRVFFAVFGAASFVSKIHTTSLLLRTDPDVRVALLGAASFLNQARPQKRELEKKKMDHLPRVLGSF